MVSLQLASSALSTAAFFFASHALLSHAALVEYKWTLRPKRASSGDTTFSPDCNLNRHMLLVNDQFPGPTLEAQVGDTVRIELTNESPSESMSLHFHGLSMKGQPYVDGTAGGTQCAMGPMQTQVYEFEVLDAGTHYWHGHLSMERGDGFQGSIVVTDPNNEDEKQLREMYDEEAILFLQDWYHLDGQARRTGLDSNPFIWIGDAQSFVINGGGIFEPCLGNETDGLACADNCSMDNYVKTLEVAAGKTYRLRLVGGQELIGVNFAIQGHKMKVVEVEGTIVEPFEVDNLDIMPAQRYSVLVTMDQEPDQYMATTTTRYRKGGPTGYIAIKYSGSPDKNITSDGLPEHPAWDDVQATFDLESQLFTKNVDYYEDSDVLSAEPESIRRIIIVGTQAKDEVLDKLRWTMNNVTMTMMNPAPVIVSAYDAVHADGSASWPETEIEGTVVVPDSPPNTWNYTEPVQDSVGVFNGDRGSAVLKAMDGEVIEVVMQNSRALNGVAEMHSFHLHGHSFYVVGMGFGTFDEENDVETYNLVNPVRRDTLALLPLGWTAFRFKANNPGVWSYHCTQVGIYRV